MDNKEGGLRPVEDIQPEEWARLQRARRTEDPRKLRALLPGWLKSHIAASVIPARTVHSTRTYLPSCETPRTDPRIGYYFPGGQQAQKRDKQGPEGTLVVRKNPSALMHATDDVAQYVAAFCKLNNLAGEAS